MTQQTQPADFDPQEVERIAKNTLKDYVKLDDIIGSQIFSILARHSRVLYYPLEDEDIWGFVEKKGENLFVCINTSISYEKQVFVAAHELYHVLRKDCSEELTLAADLEDTTANVTAVSTKELRANRFAAAFLVNEALLKREMQSLSISQETLTLSCILKLANLFTVPYKTMVRRLFELEMIDRQRFEAFLNTTHEAINIMQKRMGLMTPTQGHLISFDTLNETAMQLYERDRITVEKLTHVLRFSNLCPADMGILPVDNAPLTDDEITALMGE